MKNLSFFSKVFASLSLIFGAIWVGSYLVKIFLIYQLFIPEDLSLKMIYQVENLYNVLLFMLPSFVVPFVSYVALIVSVFLFFVSSRINMKQNGWLFITTMIILITAPFEIYLMFIDYRIISSLLAESFNAEYLLDLIRDRITLLSSFPIIVILGYISISFLIIFKPLTLKNKIT